MNFLGVGPMEIILVLLIAFIFLGPERMTEAVRMLAKIVREARNLAAGIPRVVIEDDDIKIVDRGESTSISGRPPPESAARPQDDPVQTDDAETGGPVPFSRASKPILSPTDADADQDRSEL